MHRGVVSATPKNFEKQTKYLVKHFNIITFDDLAKHFKKQMPLPKNPLIVTFDDGYKDNYMNAYPILLKYKVPATFFLTTNCLDNNIMPWWDKLAYMINKTKISRLKLPNQGTFDLDSKAKKIRAITRINKNLKNMEELKKKELLEKIQKRLKVKLNKNLSKDLFLSWKNIKEMSKNGMSFGAHTVTHCNLAKSPFRIAKQEIIESKKKIEQRLQRKILAFCYPYDKQKFLSQDVINLLRESGFFCAVSNELGINTLNDKLNLCALKRIDIYYQDSLAKFKMKLNESVINSYALLRGFFIK